MKSHQWLLFGVLALASAPRSPAAQFKFATQTLTVPDGFEVEIVAGTDLVPRPVSGSFDEQGRLYVTDSSGSNAKPAEQTNNPAHRVLRLEDTDGDGKFDKSVVFADKVMFPEGCLWYDGSVYVAAPPHIWKFTDTNNDGVADKREIWHDGQTLTGCANDLHGPFLGPDGWIYWCKGAFAEQTYEVNGKPWKSRASHIFRARPDHSRLEPVITAGNDNPVGLTWTATGERILCGTFFAPHEPGHRDGMVHAVYGAVFGKPNDVLEGHKLTGDLMPVMTHMGAAAPCAVLCYKSTVFGDDYEGNVFCCQFNMHKVSRHILVPDGATFKTTDSDFLVSDNPDFHPTDVIEDADGSLLVLDTGAWYKLCCPTSQLAKPDVLGAIYRIRRKGAPNVVDPRGARIAWAKSSPTELAGLLSAHRPAVVERAIQELGKRGGESIPALTEILQHAANLDALRNAAWALTRIEDVKARRAVYTAFAPEAKAHTTEASAIAQVAVNSIGLWRDVKAINAPLAADVRAVEGLEAALGSRVLTLRRTAVEAFGRLGVKYYAVPRLLRVAGDQRPDRFMEHAILYALIELDDPQLTRNGLGQPVTQRIALIALDQMDSGQLKPAEVLPLLRSPDAEIRNAAMWVSGHHPEWGGALAGFFRERLAAKEINDADRADLERQLAQFINSEPVQQLFVESLNTADTSAATRQSLLRLMAQPGLKEAPAGWADAVSAALDQQDEALVRAAIPAARALAQAKNHPPTFAERLQKIARDTSQPEDMRLEALAALTSGMDAVEVELLNFLLANIDPAKSVAARGAAAGVLVKARLTEEQLLTLAEALKTAGPMEVARLLPAFERGAQEATGLRLMAALKESKGLAGVQADTLKAVAKKYPATVQEQAEALLALLNADAEKQKAQLDALQASLPPGDIRRGQLVFNSTKAACASCHRMGYLGGNVGPDLTAIGPVRTERDLLEAIVYPSASFVRSYEPYTIVTKNDEDYSGVLRKDAPDEVILATGPNTEVRIARSDIAEMRPSRVSVMPAGLDQQLSRQELSDLVTFLKHTKWGAD